MINCRLFHFSADNPRSGSGSTLSVATPPQLYSPSSASQPSVITRLPRPQHGSPFSSPTGKTHFIYCQKRMRSLTLFSLQPTRRTSIINSSSTRHRIRSTIRHHRHTAHRRPAHVIRPLPASRPRPHMVPRHRSHRPLVPQVRRPPAPDTIRRRRLREPATAGTPDRVIMSACIGEWNLPAVNHKSLNHTNRLLFACFANRSPYPGSTVVAAAGGYPPGPPPPMHRVSAGPPAEHIATTASHGFPRKL